MNRHVTLETLWSKRQGLRNDPEVETHLLACASCRELDEVIERIAHFNKVNAPRQQPRPEQPCTQLAPEILGNYFVGGLSLPEKEQVEEHLSFCGDCQHQLAAMLKLETTGITEEEVLAVNALPAVNSTKLVSQLFDNPSISPLSRWKELVIASRKTSGYRRVLDRLKISWQQRPAYALALLATTAMIFAALLGMPKIKIWRGNALAGEGMAHLQQQHRIPLERLRFSGRFFPALVDEVRSADAAESDEHAAARFAESLQWDRENLMAARGQALLTYFSGDTLEAYSLFQRLSLDYPSDVQIINDLGVVSAALDAPGAALHYFDRALALKPDFVEAHYNRAALLQDLKRTEEARLAWLAYMQRQEGGIWEKIAQGRLKQLP